MPDHQERPPNALAHGPVKSRDIDRVRRDVDLCGAQVAHEQKTFAEQREMELRREAELRKEPELSE